MGLGHIIRSSALCRMLNNTFECILLTRCSIPWVLELAGKTYHEIIRLPEEDFEEEAKKISARVGAKDIVLLDGYDFKTAYQQSIKASQAILVCIDDIHAYPFLADCIINHSGGISKTDYNAPPYCQFFLGPSFSLIGLPFQEAAKRRKNIDLESRRCLICLGGADPGNQTLAVLKQLAEKRLFDKYEIIVGSGYVYKSLLVEEIKRNGYSATVHHAVSPEEMIIVMEQCPFAVCAPSTVAYEYMSVGGVLFLHQIADNQKDVIRFMIAEKLAFPLEQITQVSPDECRQAVSKQALYFDGLSAERFTKLFQNFLLLRDLQVRAALPDDLQVTFEWANDKLVREQSYSRNAITIATHTKWFLEKIQDSRCRYFILENNGMPVGQIRFDIENGKATLGYLVAPGERNKGLGPVILALGIKQLMKVVKDCNEIVGFVKNTNIASQKAFERFSFIKTNAVEYPDSVKYTLFYGNNSQ